MNSSSTIETFTAHRQFLFSIAYRMLGSLSEAEGMVQEAWLRRRGSGEDRRRAQQLSNR
ncbi:MAG TPA: sigma factor [Verrucomicrobiae bacterium]|nr:sigma factor [Verrucomicrobiae bacterium]